MSEQQPTQEIVTLPTSGHIAGIPGTHGAGTYAIDWDTRTISPYSSPTEGGGAPEPSTQQESAPKQEETQPVPTSPTLAPEQQAQ